MAKKLEKPANIDDYLQSPPAAQRATPEKLHQMIRSSAPDAEECISYGIPALRQDGMLVGFGASANHCSFFLMDGTTVRLQEQFVFPRTNRCPRRCPRSSPKPGWQKTRLVVRSENSIRDVALKPG
jgi:uncharacterized protein DUF1801